MTRKRDHDVYFRALVQLLSEIHLYSGSDLCLRTTQQEQQLLLVFMENVRYCEAISYSTKRLVLSVLVHIGPGREMRRTTALQGHRVQRFSWIRTSIFFFFKLNCLLPSEFWWTLNVSIHFCVRGRWVLKHHAILVTDRVLLYNNINYILKFSFIV